MPALPGAVLPLFAKSLREQLSETLFDQLVEMCEGAVAVDTAARIVWIDDKYKALLGVDDSCVGKPVERVIPQSLMRRVVDTGKPILLDIMQFGERSFVVIRFPLKDANNVVQGAVGFVLFDRFQYLQPIIAKFTALQAELAQAQKQLAGERSAKYSFSQFLGISEATRTVKKIARRAAQIDSTVLLLGETGTGKELLAHAIHAASSRANKPFVAVNMAAIPETLMEAEFFGVAPGAFTGADRKGRAGKLAMADGGTLFLDEIGDMPLSLQPKLLRALQEREVEQLGSDRVKKIDVRVVAATSRDLRKMVEDRAFRADLYYRINVLPITVAPLRQRLEDIESIAESLLERIAQRLNSPHCDLAASAIQMLRSYSWPGNVRELANVLERMATLSDSQVLTAADVAEVLPGVSPHAGLAPPANLQDAVADAERRAILAALAEAKGVKAVAARLLGISRANLYDKLTRHGLAAQ
jgi:transcriptional regulator with PAS, ATPase and Fis domain